MKLKQLVVTLCTTLSVGAFAVEYHEERSGFYLSGGLGFGSTTLGITDSTDSVSEGYGSFATSFKVGGYLNPQFALYYQREASWFEPDDSGLLFTAGLTGLGGTYYFKPNRGLYAELGVGLGDLMISDSSGSAADTGFGFMIGLGSEVSDHFQAGATFTYASITDETEPDLTIYTSAIAGKVEFKL